MKRIKTFELYGYENGNLPGVPRLNTDLLLKNFPKIPKYELKRDKSGYWNVYKNGGVYPTRIDFPEEEIDNQIRYVKDVLKRQRRIPAENIIVDKDINGGIVKFIINQ